MRKIASSLFAASLSLGISLAMGLPANAAPVAQSPMLDMNAQQMPVENVQYREWQQWPERNWRDGPRYRYDRPYRRGWDRPYREYRPRHYRPHHYRPAPRYRAGNPHVRWCYNRYRSYRAYDNTFQPNYGPRRQCYSPYL